MRRVLAVGTMAFAFAVGLPGTPPAQAQSPLSCSAQMRVYGWPPSTARPLPTVFRPSNSTWYVDTYYSGDGIQHAQFGQPGDVPCTSIDPYTREFNPLLFRPSTGTWYRPAPTYLFPIPTAVTFGGPGDVPLHTDVDSTWHDNPWGVLQESPVIFRPSNGRWFQWNAVPPWSTDGVPFGGPGDVPIPQRQATAYVPGGPTPQQIGFPAVFRPSTGYWYRYDHGPGDGTPFGGPGDIPVGWRQVFRPSNGTWYSEGLPPVQFGSPGDIPALLPWGPGDVPTLFRPSNARWYAAGPPEANQVYPGLTDGSGYPFGNPGDIPLLGPLDQIPLGQ